MKILPLTKAQQRIWLEWKLMPANPAYNNPLRYRLLGDINIKLLEQVLNYVVQKNPVLRCYFIEQGGMPKQVLVSELQAKLDYHDLAEVNIEEIDSHIENIINDNVRRGFNLEQLPLFRFTLIRKAASEYYFILNIHHIVVDGHSATLLLQDISNYYNSAVNNNSVEMVSHDDVYIQYINSLSNNEEEAIEHLAFWQKQLGDANSMVNLPISNAKDNNLHYYEGHRYHFALPTELTKKIKLLAKQCKTTDFIILLASFYIVLAKYADQYDLTVSYPIDIRPNAYQELFGFFVNNIPFRVNFSSAYNFKSLVELINKQRKLIKPHQQADLLDITRYVRQAAPHVHGALSNTSFIRANFALAILQLTNIQIIPEPIFTGGVKDDLCLLYDYNDTFEFEIEYRLQQFEFDFIKQLEQSFIGCLEYITHHSECKIADIEFHSDLNKTNLAIVHGEDIAVESNLIARFIKHVRNTPEKLAVITSDEQVSYQKLFDKVSNLILHLLLAGIEDDKPVIVCLERTPDLLAALLTLQWLGITYIPVDPTIPESRLLTIIEDSNAAAIITEQNYDQLAKLSAINFIHLSAVKPMPIAYSLPAPKESKIAYIIYTSGSTGKPKGVMVSNGALTNFLASMQDKPGCGEADLLLAITTVAFDIAGLELFLPIWAGSGLFLANQQQHKDPFALKKILEHYPISILQATPAMWQMLIDAKWQGSKSLTALCGGEALTAYLAGQLLSRVKILWNMYGPTEATIWCSAKAIGSAEKITVGKPIANMQICIMDEQRKILPRYAKGELYISGKGLAEGYINRADLTASSFLTLDNTDIKIYKTGDIASMTKEGEVIIYGRKDNQVKLHGYRIELGEIESQLLNIPDINQAAVVIHKQNLIAFISGHHEQLIHLTEESIHEQLAGKLPDYMLPKRYIILPQLPLTVNAKIDRKALPIETIELGNPLEAPKTELEHKLAVIWQEVLQQPQVSVTANFFSYGGHSLLATQIIAKINQMLNYSVQLSDFFAHPTIRSLGKKLEQDADNLSSGLVKTSLPFYPLTHAQKRIWFLQQLDGDIGQFNMAASITVKGSLNVELLKQAFVKLCKMHPVLMTNLGINNHEPYQTASENFQQLPLEFLTVNQLSDNAGEKIPVDTFLQQWASKPFKLTANLLWRACLIQLADDNYVLGICLHHMIADGYSTDILLKDLWAYYDQPHTQPIELPVINYFDYAVWDNQLLLDKACSEFWQKELLGCSYLELPSDRPRSARQDYKGKQLNYLIEGKAWQEVQQLCQQQSISISSLFITCFSLLLYRITGLTDFCIGLPIANRTMKETDQMVGCFINIIPLRITLPSQIDFSGLVEQIQAILQKAMAHSHLPFSKLLEQLNIPRELNKSPLFSVLLNIQPNVFSNNYSQQLTLSTAAIHTSTAKYDFSLDLYYSEKAININIEYATSLFEAETIAAWSAQYQTILLNQIKQPAALINFHSLIGKIDEPTTLILHQPVAKTALRKPETPLQNKVAELWQNLLNVETVGLESNFFALGGHSLIATKLIGILNDELAIELPLETIFTHPSLEALSKAIQIVMEHQQVQSEPKNYANTLLPLTPNQKQLVMLEAQNNTDLYHLGIMIELPQEMSIEKEVIKSKLKFILNQHSIYQWQLKVDGLSAELAGSIDQLEIEEIISNTAQQTVDKARTFHAKPFNLCKAPLIRFALVREMTGKNYLLITMHHLIGDEWTLQALIEKLFQPHKDNLLANGVPWESVIATWLQPAQTALSYWNNYLLNKKQSVILPTRLVSETTDNLASVSLLLPKLLAEQCLHLSKDYNTSLYLFMLAHFLMLVRLYTGDSEINICGAYDRRKTAQLQKTHGYIVNLLPICIDLHSVSTLKDLIDYLIEDRAAAFKYAEVDFGLLAEQGIVNKPDIIFNFQHKHQLYSEQGEPIKWQEIKSRTAKFALVMQLRELADGSIELVMDYNSDRYDEQFIQYFVQTYKELLELATENKAKNITDWRLTQQALMIENKKIDQTMLDQSFLEVLRANAAAQPAAIAVQFDNYNITYGDLWTKVTRLAWIIKQHCQIKGENTIVAVQMSNSEKYIITILAILYAGAAFLPIDKNLPAERKQFMLNHVNADMLIVDEEDTNFAEYAGKITTYHALMNLTKNLAESFNEPLLQSAKNLSAYVIYTSGTTGKPKAVQIRQESLHYFVDQLQKKLLINGADKILQYASISFDASIWEVFLALYSGATLVIPNGQERMAGKALQDFIQLRQITHMLLTPAVLNTLDPSHLSSLRSVASGGEACTSTLVERWSGCVDFYNAYGPTEATVCSNLAKMKPNMKPSNIGQPLGVAKLQIVNENLQLLPKGAIGELLILGETVGDGYVNDPQLSEQKFISQHACRGYLTGDYVRLLADNNLEYISRRDRQIKLRGLRIELAEIEEALHAINSIRQAVCLVYEEQIVAYVVSDKPIEAKEIIAILAQQLPAYMLPSKIIPIESIPVKTTGKIDHSQLPLPITETAEAKILPSNETEKTIYNIWHKYLKTSELSIDMDFFAAGGNSLQLMQIATDIHKVFNVEFSMKHFYENSSINLQAQYIEANCGDMVNKSAH
jgi:amino acid adenylation domain-containing protein